MQEPIAKTIEQMTDYLSGRRDIRLAILFGSMATGQPGRDSDVDIAILGERPLSADARLQIIEDLGRVTGRPADLVDLATAGVPIIRSALLAGRVLFSRDERVYPQQITRMLIDSADFLPYRERMLEERYQSWIR